MPSLNSSKYQPAHPINNQLINNIQSDALRIFILVYEQLSFSAVARMDNVSPSSISRSILQLEQNLGVQLFYRNTRHLVASEYAGILIVYARQIQSQLNQALTALQQHSGEIKGWVRINAPVLFGQMHLAPHLAVLQQQFPALLIDLQLSDDFIDPYQDAADLIFRISPMPDSSLKSRVIDRCKYHLAASPAYLQKKGYSQQLRAVQSTSGIGLPS
ncbi:regulatory helix-turn-helix LysR family protein [Acinetobacter calcoaceticus]|uniref:Regulatory helix-turn-helix LysR family protein n=1 Tax=Acinetobacter calcoaceticus TaxID=471 RepID=A0A4R1XP73_ACICA|nr:regulatory helix-turn-helix LysR family protein [Acinetobacter calcoaceticus]